MQSEPNVLSRVENSTRHSESPMDANLKRPGDGRPLLTIAIPTYNRARYLNELLSVLFDQLKDKPNIELIISDNASPDETPGVVRSFVDAGMRISYLRSVENIGPDANFLLCFEKAKGKYVWLIGDDDIIVPGGIAKILALISMDEYSLVYASPYWFRTDYSAERTEDRFGRVAEVLPSGLEFARKTGAMIGFITAVIVNKDHYSTNATELSHLVGTNLAQLGWVCPLLDKSSKNLFVWERLVGARAGNTGEFGACRVFGVNLKQIVESALANRKDICEALQNSTLRVWFPGVIMDLRRGTGSPLYSENMRELLEPIYKENWRYWVYVFPLIAFPLPIAGVWYSVTKFAKRLTSLFSVIFDHIFSGRNMVKQLAIQK